MLYITTRSSNNTYTAHKALTSDFGPDGGRYVPFRFPQYSTSEIAQLKEKTFCQTVAEILNMFFSARLDPLELESRLGSDITRIIAINHKIVVAELWHNTDGTYSYLERVLRQALTGVENEGEAKEWVRICIKIATLFGLYGEMLRQDLLLEGQYFDVSVNNDDFETPITAWYCRIMGLPVNVVICACVDNSNLWDFIHRGTISTTLLSASLQLGVERLIQGTFGCNEAEKYRLACEGRNPYSVNDEMLPRLNRGLFCSVSGEDRTKQTINSVFRSNAYIMDPGCALSFSGLQDYRAKTGNSVTTLLLSQCTPNDFAAEISDYTGVPVEKLNEYISNH